MARLVGRQAAGIRATIHRDAPERKRKIGGCTRQGEQTKLRQGHRGDSALTGVVGAQIVGAADGKRFFSAIAAAVAAGEDGVRNPGRSAIANVCSSLHRRRRRSVVQQLIPAKRGIHHDGIAKIVQPAPFGTVNARTRRGIPGEGSVADD